MNNINDIDKTLANEAIKEVLGQTELNDTIIKVDNAANALMDVAYEDDDHMSLFRNAREMMTLRDRLIRIERVLGYEPDR